MILNLTVNDPRSGRRNASRLALDWGRKQWSIPDGQQQGWSGIGYSSKGTFELKSWGVMWLWDQPSGQQKRNTMILWNPPAGESDSLHFTGLARIHDPKDPALRDGRVSWSVDASAKAAKPQGLSPIRAKVLDICAKILPLPIGTFLTPGKKPMTDISSDTMDSPNVIAEYAKGKKYTNCGALPAYVAKKLNSSGMLTRGMSAGLKGWAMEKKVWTPADGIKRPQPGDIYVLEKPQGKFSHDGIIIKSEGTNWVTADSGQGFNMKDAGFAACYRNRSYANGELEGEPTQGGGLGYLAGWIDIETPGLFPNWDGKR
jgi:hypothetical protein